MSESNDQTALELLRDKLNGLLPNEETNQLTVEARSDFSTASHQFQSFVFELVRLHLEKNVGIQTESLVPSKKIDFISNASVNDLPSPIGIETKFLRSRDYLRKFLGRILDDVARQLSSELQAFVLVTNIDPSDEVLSRFRSRLEEAAAKDKIVIQWWGEVVLNSRTLRSLIMLSPKEFQGCQRSLLLNPL